MDKIKQYVIVNNIEDVKALVSVLLDNDYEVYIKENYGFSYMVYFAAAFAVKTIIIDKGEVEDASVVKPLSEKEIDDFFVEGVDYDDPVLVDLDDVF